MRAFKIAGYLPRSIRVEIGVFVARPSLRIHGISASLVTMHQLMLPSNGFRRRARSKGHWRPVYRVVAGLCAGTGNQAVTGNIKVHLVNDNVFPLGVGIGGFSAAGWVSSFLLPGPVQGPKKTPVVSKPSFHTSEHFLHSIHSESPILSKVVISLTSYRVSKS